MNRFLANAAFRTSGAMARFISPKTLISISKYMYIRNLIDFYSIDLIIDVGANVGHFGSSMRKIGYKGRILSFEPLSETFKTLKQAADGDRDWQVFNFALGEVAGIQTINVMTSSVFSSFKSPSTAETSDFADGNTVMRREDVEIKRFSEVCSDLEIERQLNSTFLKCDTQGFDMHVLRGVGDFLRSIRLLQVELGVTRIYEDSVGMTEMLAFLEDVDFRPVAMFPINRMPNWSAAEMDYLGVNISLS